MIVDSVIVEVDRRGVVKVWDAVVVVVTICIVTRIVTVVFVLNVILLVVKHTYMCCLRKGADVDKRALHG